MEQNHRTGMVTKRHLGILLLVVGTSTIIVTLAIDWIGAGEFSGIGPLQRYALLGGALVTLIGISLIPLGNRPA